MTAGDVGSRSASSRLLAGAVLGAVAGLLVDLFGVRGLALLVAVAMGSAFVRPRFALLGGVLIGAGGLWLPFTIGAVALCTADRSRCSSTAPEPFAIVAAVVLTAGLLATVWTRRRLERASDIARR
jgi:hypothetical protein